LLPEEAKPKRRLEFSKPEGAVFNLFKRPTLDSMIAMKVLESRWYWILLLCKMSVSIIPEATKNSESFNMDSPNDEVANNVSLVGS
jgi:hypothetical protein